MTRAAALIIGNEILAGKIQEANVVGLSRVLRDRGVELGLIHIVPDELDTIADQVRDLAARFDHLFTSGGIGPTHDDVTIAAIARAFDVPVVSDPGLEALLRDYYGDAVTENHLLLARVPRGARPLFIDTTPWPLTAFRNVWILPGVPEIFRMKLAIIREHLDGGRPFVTRAVYTKLDEAELKPLLDAVVDAHPRVDVGSYPRFRDPRYETKVTFDGRDPSDVETACRAFQDGLPDGEPQWVD